MEKTIPKKYITINTDASFCHKTKIGGYAFWIKSDFFTIKKQGHFNSLVDNSTDAELRCIANAIATLSVQNLGGYEYILVINTDSKGAVGWMKNPQNKTALICKLQLDNLLELTNCTFVKWKHVKAHSNKDDARSFVNDWCDKMSRKEMHKYRKEQNKFNK
jgi:ribonuclease HI